MAYKTDITIHYYGAYYGKQHTVTCQFRVTQSTTFQEAN